MVPAQLRLDALQWLEEVEELLFGGRDEAEEAARERAELNKIRDAIFRAQMEHNLKFQGSNKHPVFQDTNIEF
eukprot:1811299-Rhodomonas_salina.3